MKKEIKLYKAKSILDVTEKDSLYCLKADNETEFKIVVTDLNGNPVNLKDLTGGSGSITNVINTDGTITVTGSTIKDIKLSTVLYNLIQSALQNGANISQLTNDVGYITLSDVHTPNLQQVLDIGNESTTQAKFKNIPGEFGDYSTENDITSLGTSIVLSSTNSSDEYYSALYAGFTMALNTQIGDISKGVTAGENEFQTTYDDSTHHTSANLIAGQDGGEINLKNTTANVKIGSTNITENITLEAPSKTAGTYTIATTDDITTFTPSEHDLDEFTNIGIDPYAHISDVNSGAKLGLIRIEDTAHELFTDLSTAQAYLRTFTTATITDESFNNGVYYFSVPSGSEFIEEDDFFNACNCNFYDPLGLISKYRNGAFGNCSGIIELGNILLQNPTMDNFANSATGKFIIHGNIGTDETANYPNFFLGSTATIWAKKEKRTSNSGGIEGDLAFAQSQGCKLFFGYTEPADHDLNDFNNASSDPFAHLSDITSPLETITEGGHTGIALRGRNPLNYGDIGQDAIDLSYSNEPNSIVGATGSYSFAEGQNTTASGYYSHAEGYNNIASGDSSHTEGYNNIARSFGEHAGGTLGTDYSPTNTDTDRLFNLGNGDFNAEPPIRSDAFTIFKNGAVKFFRATLASITNATEGFLIFDSGNSNRPTIHNGTAWKALAYLSDVIGGSETNLSYTPSPTDGTVNSDTGTDATIPLADGTNAGLISPSEKAKLSELAVNSNIVHLTGNENITGKKTFNNSGSDAGASFVNNTTNNDGAANVRNSSTGWGLNILNQDIGYGLVVQNQDTGIGAYMAGTSSGTTLQLENSDTGNSIPLIVSNNGTEKFRIENTGLAKYANDYSSIYTSRTLIDKGYADAHYSTTGGGSETNLSYTPSPTDGTVNSDTGTDATIPLADGTNAGLISPSEKTKLSGIANGANVGVVPNSAITGATKTKITYDNKGLVTSGTDATTADISDSTDKRYVTDANLTKINAIDQAVSTSEKATWNGKQDALGFTPEDVANKQTDLTASATKYPTVNAVNTGLGTKEPTITAGTTAQYWRGDKSWQTFPTIPTVGTWGTLNYPTWASGTPFVKMTASGTFALDTNTYLTSASLTTNVTGILPIANGGTNASSYNAPSGNICPLIYYDGTRFSTDATIIDLGYDPTTDTFYSGAINIKNATTQTAKFTNTNTKGALSGAGMQGYSDDGSAMASGNRLGFYALGGATNTSHVTSNASIIEGFATENWSGTQTGSSLVLSTTPNGSTSRSNVITLDQDQKVIFHGLTATTVPYLDNNKKLQSSSVTPTQLGYVDFTSSGQTQLNNKLNVASPAYTGSLTTGTLGYSDTGILSSLQSAIAGYNQVILRNSSNDVSASSDYVLNNDLSTASTYYGDFGMNSSTFTGTGSFAKANAVYLSASNGDLVLGTITSNLIRFVVNNGATDAMNISASGVLNIPALTASRVLTTDSSSNLTASSVTTTTLGYLDATSSIQTQLDLKAPKADPSFTGLETNTGATQTGSSAVGILDLYQTWNTTGAPSAIKVTITDTQSAPASYFFNFLVGSTPKFRVDKSGALYTNVINNIAASSNMITMAVGAMDYQSGTVSAGTQHSLHTSANALTSGVVNVVSAVSSINPTSGNVEHNYYTTGGTINQTGTSSGLIRGFYFNPTLTALRGELRAIDITKGSIVFPYASATTTYAVKTSDYLVNFTTGTFTATLPTSVGQAGKTYIFKNTGATSVITIATTSSQTIDGSATYMLTALNKYVSVVSDGANWIIVANN